MNILIDLEGGCVDLSNVKDVYIKFNPKFNSFPKTTELVQFLLETGIDIKAENTENPFLFLITKQDELKVVAINDKVNQYFITDLNIGRQQRYNTNNYFDTYSTDYMEVKYQIIKQIYKKDN